MTIRVILVVRLSKREGPSVSRAEVVEQLLSDVEALDGVWVEDTCYGIDEVGLGSS